jgi:ketosteroid isomerase-like protein
MSLTPPSEPEAWMRAWRDAIRARDYDAGRRLFAPEVESFGTLAGAVSGLDGLCERQWREIWPQTEAFDFDWPGLKLWSSGERDLVLVACGWESRGVRPDGTRYPRRGFATVALRRAPDGGLRAVHTHFAMAAGYAPRHDRVLPALGAQA